MSRMPDAWPALGEEILAGLCHEMNGRLNTLRGTLELARLDDQVDEAVGDELAAELERLEHTVRLLRHLGAERDPEPEPIRPIELLPLAVTLLRHHRELAGIEAEVVETGETPAVLAPWSRLLRLLALLVAGAAEAAGREASAGVRVEVRVDADDVVVEAGGGAAEGVEAAGTRGAAAAGPVRPSVAIADAVRAAAEALGGTLGEEGGRVARLAVRLPAWREEA